MNNSLIENLRQEILKLQKDCLKLKSLINSCEASAKNLRNQISTSNHANINSKLLSLLQGIGRRANGGNIAAGTHYLVGERGPELFTSHVSGNITPNAQVASNRAINLFMNISTTDSDSFRRSQDQILAEASRAMRHASRNL